MDTEGNLLPQAVTTTSTTVVPFKKEQELPYSLEAEQGLLGILLVDNRLLETVSDYLKPYHFANGVHGKIYEGILRLNGRGLIADPVTLKDYFEKDQALEPVGGAAYLAELVKAVISMSSAGDYGRLIYDFYLRRELLGIGQEIVTNAKTFEFEDTPIRQIEAAEKRLFDLATKGQSQGGLTPISFTLTSAVQMIDTAIRRESKLVGVTSGLKKLDEMLGGFHPSDLIILAGRPSMGKTALVTNIAYNAAKATFIPNGGGANVAFFSLEMSSEQLALRMLSSESGISSSRMRTGNLDADHFTHLTAVAREMENLPLFIDDTPAITLGALRNRCRRLQRQHGLGMIIVDYLQLINGSTGNKSEGRTAEISNISRGLKAIAKELHVPVIALSQLSRAVEQREDKRPQLSDLRESGSIEQDADVVMFVYREAYYLERKKPQEHKSAGEGERDNQKSYQQIKGEVDTKLVEWQQKMSGVHAAAEISIAKQRHGPIGTVPLSFNSMLTKFEDPPPTGS